MNRNEALRTLGLDNDATEADIKAAYKEMAQILHPDKFKTNKRLEERATEQFKRVNEARDLLLSGRSAGPRGGRNSGSPWSGYGGGSPWGGAGGSPWNGGGWGGAGQAGAGGAGGAGSAKSAAEAYSWKDSEDAYGSADTKAGLKARLAGIAAARTQLTSHLDGELDRRRIGIYMVLGGIAVAAIAPLPLKPLGSVLLIWGAVQFFGAYANVSVIRDSLKKLDAARKGYEEKLKAL